jgi:DNA-binding transcriptional regulator YiaG
MKSKNKNLYMYEGLGFPIHLHNAQTIELRGECVLDIDYNKLQKAVLLHLCHKKSPLTGNEVKFIRKYFSLTTTAFGNLFGYSHSAILKWENQGDSIARIIPTTEIYLRLYILENLHKKATDFKELYDEIKISDLSKYLKSAKIYKYIPFTIDALQILRNVA